MDEKNETELRAEFGSLLADGFLRYIDIGSKQIAIDHADRDSDAEFETAFLVNRSSRGPNTGSILEALSEQGAETNASGCPVEFGSAAVGDSMKLKSQFDG